MTIKVIQTMNPSKEKLFANEQEALDFIKRQRKAKGFYTMINEKPAEKKTKEKKENWKDKVDFTDAINVNRENVKYYYGKSGYIKVVDNTTGEVKHIGKTTNMGKVFSNYVNCAKYNQSYDFDLNNKDRLYFKESDLIY